jgi:NSS family neurotransmitter:Na+ symporter
MTSSLFVVLLILFGYASTLSGFGQAVEYVLSPNFSELTALGVLKALGLALFTLSLGYGVMVTYGSYMKDSDDIPKTSIIVGVANFVAAILIALMMYPMVFTFGFEPQAGEGLIFITLPYVFEQLPGSIIISVFFFALLIFAALTSSVSMLEVAVANFIDLFKWSRKKAVLISTAIVFVLGLPTALSGSKTIFSTWDQIFGNNFLSTVDILSDWILTSVALFTAIFVGFYLDDSTRQKAFTSGSTLAYLYRPWLFLVRFIVPAAILLVISHRAGLLNIGLISSWLA